MHSHSPISSTLSRRSRTIIVSATVTVLLATFLGMIKLWPTGLSESESIAQSGLPLRKAKVTAIEPISCYNPVNLLTTGCEVVGARLTSGPDKGEEIALTIRDTDEVRPFLKLGERIVLVERQNVPDEFRYSFSDYERSRAIWLLVAMFVLIVLLVGRLTGVRALTGTLLSVGFLLMFTIPSIARGNNEIAVAAITTVLVGTVVIATAHGFNLGSLTALIGTFVSLFATGTLAVLWVVFAKLTNLFDESSQILRYTNPSVNLKGLLIAGIIIGALGALDDVTITQVSTFNEIRRANPSMPTRSVLTATMKVGRDHIASIVNTLVLAYAGASMSTLLIFSESNRAFSELMMRELVAVEIVRTLVGTIGLVLAVPITTYLAAVILKLEPTTDSPIQTTADDTA